MAWRKITYAPLMPDKQDEKHYEPKIFTCFSVLDTRTRERSGDIFHDRKVIGRNTKTRFIPPLLAKGRNYCGFISSFQFYLADKWAGKSACR